VTRELLCRERLARARPQQMWKAQQALPLVFLPQSGQALALGALGMSGQAGVMFVEVHRQRRHLN